MSSYDFLIYSNGQLFHRKVTNDAHTVRADRLGLNFSLPINSVFILTGGLVCEADTFVCEPGSLRSSRTSNRSVVIYKTVVFICLLLPEFVFDCLSI